MIPAVSFHAGNAYFLSYGWSGDPVTVFETTVANATLAAAGVEAANLAAAGYIITALGRNGAGGLVRVRNPTVARRWKIGGLACLSKTS